MRARPAFCYRKEWLSDGNRKQMVAAAWANARMRLQKVIDEGAIDRLLTDR
jgi:hypothetical protein